MSDLLRSLAAVVELGGDVPAFAVLHRSERQAVEVMVGTVVDVARLGDIPLPESGQGPQVLAMVPYRQVRERGFTCHDDGSPLRCLVVDRTEQISLTEALALLPTGDFRASAGDFDIDDAAYAALVDRVVREQIGAGEGANFVIRRDHLSRTDRPPAAAALRVLRRLLTDETGAYWTFAVHAGDQTMVGATPERHVSVLGGQVLMNPIAGTYRYPPAGPTGEGLLRFLDDPKETEELFMVVDEELKMMSSVCHTGGRMHGPAIKQMGALAHTEYVLEGTTDLDVRDVLLETMFAPTVMGSPVRNAARVIATYETAGRGYYSGVLALIGRDAAGRQSLDAPIIIRTAFLDDHGGIRVPVGATLVRHSIGADEAAETRAKVTGVLRAFGPAADDETTRSAAPVHLAGHPGVPQALARRNARLASFWLDTQRDAPVAALAGRSALVIDAEDAWTSMLAHMLTRLGMDVTVRGWDSSAAPAVVDLLVAGPGPGDPRDTRSPRITALRDQIAQRLATKQPLLAVCLSHQILAQLLGLPVTPLAEPHQGTQRRINLFGQDVVVGFYNTFTALTSDQTAAGDTGATICADPTTGEVHALHGEHFASVQFHLESILSPDGIGTLAELATTLLDSGPL